MRRSERDRRSENERGRDGLKKETMVKIEKNQIVLVFARVMNRGELRNARKAGSLIERRRPCERTG